MYDVMIDNFKTGLQKLMQEPTNKRQYALDMYWKRLQTQYFWYLIIPLTTVQYDNYSDVEERSVSYTDLMLDLDKERFFGKRMMHST
jgi:thiamine kinase-like enzyme